METHAAAAEEIEAYLSSGDKEYELVARQWLNRYRQLETQAQR